MCVCVCVCARAYRGIVCVHVSSIRSLFVVSQKLITALEFLAFTDFSFVVFFPVLVEHLEGWHAVSSRHGADAVKQCVPGRLSALARLPAGIYI